MREERRYGRLLLAMVAVAIVASGFVVGTDRRARSGRPGRDTRPPRRRDDLGVGPRDRWSRTLRDLIRIPSVNPPTARCPDGETAGRPLPGRPADGARPRAGDRRARPGPRLGPRRASAATGRAATRSSSSRTSTSCRRPPTRWTPRPVRGGHRRRLCLRPRRGRHEGHGRARARRRSNGSSSRGPGRRAAIPRRDPIPGLRRDVLFTCAADEEAGSPRRGALDRRAPAGLAAGGRRRQRVRRRVGDGRGPPALPDPGRREGVRAVPDPRSPARGATARCPATTTPPSWRRASSSGWPCPARSG